MFLPQCRQIPFEFAQLLFLLECRGLDHRWGIAVLEGFAPLGDVVEVGEEFVVLLLGDGVVLVVMAPRAPHREPEPNRRGGVDAIHDVLDGVFGVDDSALPVAPVIAVETGRDYLVQTRVREHVPGDLLDGELVKGLVRGERVDDPIAPAPHVAGRVGLVAVGVRVARRVKPADRHALRVAWRCQQPIHYGLVRLG